MFKRGDRVNVASSPKVWLDQYRALQPHASVTVDLTGDTEEECLEEIGASGKKLRFLLATSLKSEIEFLNDTAAVLQDSTTTEQLYTWCQEQIANGPHQVNVTIEEKPATPSVGAGSLGGKVVGGKTVATGVSPAKQLIVGSKVAPKPPVKGGLVSGIKGKLFGTSKAPPIKAG